MSFGDSIKYCFSNYANFNGRAGRPQFWYFLLFTWIVGAILTIIDSAVFGSSSFGVLSTIWALAVLVPVWAVGARRLHDTGKSGWMQLLLLIPCVGFIILIVFWSMPTTPAANNYGTETI
ncbi:unannotated protein [freshwater metagenome]|uniref:Unannotated protein n=1 Tax=freshwater metagenome TaxID=449393 RepID=A0A6J6LYN3_9ZZZZ